MPDPSTPVRPSSNMASLPADALPKPDAGMRKDGGISYPMAPQVTGKGIPDMAPADFADAMGGYDGNKEGLQEDVTVTNPNAVAHCGNCGSIHGFGCCPNEPARPMERYAPRFSHCAVCGRTHYEGRPCPRRGQCCWCSSPTPHDSPNDCMCAFCGKEPHGAVTRADCITLRPELAAPLPKQMTADQKFLSDATFDQTAPELPPEPPIPTPADKLTVPAHDPDGSVPWGLKEKPTVG